MTRENDEEDGFYRSSANRNDGSMMDLQNARGVNDYNATSALMKTKGDSIRGSGLNIGSNQNSRILLKQNSSNFDFGTQ